MKPIKNPIKTRKRNVKKLNQIMIITGIDDIQEIERLLEKQERKRKLERKKKAKEAKKPKQPKKQLRNQPFIKKEVSIDSNLVLAFIQLLVNKGMITKKELETLTLNEDNPLKQVDFKVENKVLSKSQLKGYWLYMMRHNQLFCSLCGHPITEETNKGPWRLTAEHRIPRSKGGATDSTNLDPAHEICNCVKSDIMPEEWNKVGLEILRSYGIHVDTKHALYNYLIHSKEIQR